MSTIETYLIAACILIPLLIGAGYLRSLPRINNSSAEFNNDATSDQIDHFKTTFAEAQLGDDFAQFNLGLIFVKGKGVTPDYKEAAKWFRLAAKQGNASAQNSLGVMYAKGEGVTQDFNEAVKWYRRAAEQGFATAQLNLGGNYIQGKGVPQDYKEAVKWIRKAAEQGDDEAQYNLGAMYKNGDGVPQDDLAAYAWFAVSAANGLTAGAKGRDISANKLTPSQLEKGQALAKQYYSKQNKTKSINNSIENIPEPNVSIPDEENRIKDNLESEERQFQSILNVYLHEELASIVDITFVSAGIFSGKIYRNEKNAGIINFNFDDIAIPEIQSVKICEGINRVVFSLLSFAINTTRELYVKNIERLHTSCHVKNGIITGIFNCIESAGSEPLLNGILEKIKSNSIDYGVFFYFGKDKETEIENLSIEIIHPLFSVIYLIPVEYEHRGNSAIFLIKCEEIVRFISGDAVGGRKKTSFIYMDANGRQTNREILDAKSFINNDREYINGFCLLRFQERNFRRDRIVKFI